MKNQLIYFNLIILTLFYYNSFSQETINEDTRKIDSGIIEHNSDHFKKHTVAFMISHTLINTGIKGLNDKGQWLTLASFGLNYNYNFNKKWSLGLHSHMIIEDFAVKEDEGAIIKRGTPISFALMGSYKVHQHIALLAGAGMEFSSHEDFKVVKFGIEFPFHIPNNWEIYGALLYDININAYQSISFGMGIAKLF